MLSPQIHFRGLRKRLELMGQLELGPLLFLLDCSRVKIVVGAIRDVSEEDWGVSEVWVTRVPHLGVSSEGRSDASYGYWHYTITEGSSVAT